MQCDACQSEEATVFLTQIVNGKMQKVNLCPVCAKAKGVDDPAGFQLTDLLLGLGASKDVESPANQHKCPVCGFTQTDLKKTGRLGCSHCYEVFAEPVRAMLKSMHKGTKHVGKAPAGHKIARELKQALASMESDLAEAVRSEDYEKAAHLRDRIRDLRTGENSGLAAETSK
jgi:protein arginine kinase activator